MRATGRNATSPPPHATGGGRPRRRARAGRGRGRRGRCGRLRRSRGDRRSRGATDAAIRILGMAGMPSTRPSPRPRVLGVTEPFSSGIGGGGFMLIRKPSGKVRTIDGRETAPAAMEARSFFENGEPLPFDPARYSGLSAGVPGTVATWDQALRRFGTISLRKALRPGVALRATASGSTAPSSSRRPRTRTTSTTCRPPRRSTSIRRHPS